MDFRRFSVGLCGCVEIRVQGHGSFGVTRKMKILASTKRLSKGKVIESARWPHSQDRGYVVGHLCNQLILQKLYS